MGKNTKNNEALIEDIQAILDLDILQNDNEEFPDNKRLAVRYLRDDIKLTIKRDGLFKWGDLPEVTLMDISSKGAYISSSAEIKLNKKFLFTFEFYDGKKFHTEGTIVYKFPEQAFHYGIKFMKFEHQLGDYLVVTQKELNLKK